ncbi:hypothetical protein G7Z17_g5658 [Cylindrodendrum hubeiense]|uniref:DJ-1/PfpI domain-containing protein n=1 Tax=Cylindrodendrum hubeiense TaxID=595255 RepID=A0A9P5H6N1_9HYPO|nr:hypothetical protein G7Z17_g5658 [Cylindrodendrum hubeiense]
MTFSLRTPDRKVHAGVILVKGTTELLDVAPFEFFAWVGKDSLKMLNFTPEMIEEGLDVELHWVTEDGGPTKMKSGAQIMPTDSFKTCPPLDIVLMGAHDDKYRLTEGEKGFIRESYDTCTAFLTICGGIMAMLEAGLLEGKTVTGPRMIVEALKKQVPNVNWVDKRWVHDGKVWSSSSLLNGTDLIRGFATETWGGGSGMIEASLDAGHYPARDVDFKDFHGHHFEVEHF